MQKKRLEKSIFVSIIIPAYRQQKTIQKDLIRISNVLEQLRYKYEMIVVVDGEVDSTYKKAKKLANRKLIVVGYSQNKGKGHAIRYGIAKAKGNVVGFMDAGMDINPNGLSMLLEHMEWYKADIIVGSKLHPVSKVKYPIFRKFLSIGYRMLVKLLFGLNIRDTQVGMKFFKRKVLEDVLPRLLVKTYAIDIELLAVANYLGYNRIYEAPVQLNFKKISTISSKGFVRTVGFMLWDTLAVFYRLRILGYYSHKNRKKWKKDPDLNFNLRLKI